MPELLHAATADAYVEAMRTTVDAVAHRFRTTTQPFSGASREHLQGLVDAVDLDGPGCGTATAMREVDDLFARHAVWFHDPAYLAHLNCPVALPAVAAEAVLAAVNTSVDTYDQSGIGTLIERRLVAWTAGRLGFPAGGGVFTSGGTQSNLQGVLLAREHARTTVPGLRTEDLVVLATSSSHFSVQTAARLVGLAPDAVRLVPTDEDGRMRADALAIALRHVERDGRHPMMVVATAGTTDRGCVDPLAAVADVCDATDVWLHVDAAYGCGLLVSPTRRHLLDGVERARSVTVDFHKAFFQPVSSSAFVVRHAADLRLLAHHHDYLNPEDADEPNQVDVSLQTTRRFDALKLWATLRALGPDRVGELWDATIDLTAGVHALLADDPDLRLLARTDLSTVLFRYQPDGLDDAHADALVAPVRRTLLASGRALVARTVLDGRPCLKLTLLDPTTTLADVRHVLELVRRTAADELAARHPLAAVTP